MSNTQHFSRKLADEVCENINHEKAWVKYFPSELEIGSDGKLTPRKKYRNPFRQDKNAGCHFEVSYTRPGYVFIDFVKKEYYDIFQVVSLLCHVSFYEAVNILAEDEELYTDEIVITPPVKKDYDITRMSSSCFEDFPDNDYFYAGGVTKKTLKEFGVSPARYVQYKKEVQVWRPKNPLYLYEFDSIYSQTYRPKAEKDKKFRSNVPASKIVNLNRLGKEPRKDCLIFTKSYKDIMVLHECSFPAIMGVGEGTKPNKELMEFLNLEYPKFFVLYDNDKAGVQGAERLTQEFKFLSPIFMPEGTKDPFEFSLKYGINATKQYLNEKIS
ncbi:MAG TPA: hypothetical protein PKD00_00730 [Burkholderiales bacterium]|nr:hypothetical protein [Burkholderiales bacterium]